MKCIRNIAHVIYSNFYFLNSCSLPSFLNRQAVVQSGMTRRGYYLSTKRGHIYFVITLLIISLYVPECLSLYGKYQMLRDLIWWILYPLWIIGSPFFAILIFPFSFAISLTNFDEITWLSGSDIKKTVSIFL